MKKKSAIIILLVLTVFCGSKFAYAQIPQHFIQGFSGNNVFPLGSSTSNQTQFLILASELSGVLQSGNINKIYIGPASSVASTTFTNFTVKIGMTTLNDLGSGATPYLTGLTTAIPASTKTFTNIVADSWIEIPLDNVVYYDGVSNLIIEISQTSYTSSLNLRINTGITGRRIFGPVGNPSGTAGGGRIDFGMDLSALGPNNAGLASLTSPINFCPGTENIKVKVKNYGNNVINSVKVAWSLDGIAQPTYTLSTPLDTVTGAGINEIEVTLGSHTFTTAPVAFKAWTFLPNNVQDTVNQNDTIIKTLQASLSGTYTINSALATGGSNYQSFTDFADDLNAYGICGPVVANVSGGPFNEFVYFGNISGTSATNTIRINGNGGVVQYNNTITQRQMLTLAGTKYLTIDSLTFKTLATDYGWGALLTSGAGHDSIINCIFDMTSITSTGSANSNGLAFSASATSATSTGANGNDCYIGNNHFKWSNGTGGGYYALAIAGPSNNNIIENNLVENYYYYGTYINGATGTQILNNEYHKLNKTASLTTFYGIYTTGITPGMKIMANRIHHPGGLNGYTGTFYGIYSLGDGTALDPILIANNAIYQINQAGIIYGIYLSTAPYSFVYHNTVVIDMPLTSSSANYGLYSTGNNTDVEFKNNNIVITAGTTGIKYGFYYSTATSIADVQKNNIYVNSTQAGVQNYGYFTSAYTTQATFQAANPTLEIGSPSVDPQFVNPIIGDLNVQNIALMSAGENLSAIVPKDINGYLRPITPTIGAFEHPPTGSNNAGMISFITPSGNFCTGQQAVRVSINNAGLNDITNLKLNWTVDGVAQTQISYLDTLVPATSTTGQNTDTVILGNINFQSSVPTVIKAWTSMPNGVGDPQNNNDTIQFSFQASEFILNVASESICAGANAVMSITPNSGYNVGDLEWQSSSNGTTWTGIPNTDVPNYTANNLITDTYYRVKVGSGINSCYSDSLHFSVVTVTSPTVVPGDRCGSGTVNLSASGAMGNSLNWYSVATGGSPLATTPNFTTPILNATTNYWVGAVQFSPFGIAGRNDYTGISQVAPNNTGQGIRFNALRDINLDSVSVWVVSDTGSIIVQLQNAGNGVLSTDTFNFSNSGATPTSRVKIYLPVNYYLPLGSNYKILAYPGTNVTLSREQNINPPFSTYGINGVLDIVSSWVNGVANSVNYYYFYNLFVSAGCESPRQMVTATINPPPVVNIGNDTTICSNANFTLNAGNPGSSYIWNDNSTNQTLSVFSTGIYSVTVTDTIGCSNSDTIEVTAGIAPVNNLASLYDLCYGDTITLDAGNPGSTFAWSNATTNQTTIVSAAGTYDVLITSTDNCTLTSSTNVLLRPLPVVNLGNDTAICGNSQIVLDAGNAGMNYLWSTGDTSQSIFISSPNTYSVTVTSQYGCQSEDEITITTLPAPTVDGFNFIDLSNETSGKVKFSPINPQNVITYDWDFGDGSPHVTDSDPIHTYTSNGIFTVTLKVLNDCGESQTSLTINVDVVGITELKEAILNFTLYPNPSHQELTILNNNNDVQMQKISIVNVLGAVVYDRKINNQKNLKINVSAFASGVYTAQIFTDKGMVTMKFEILK